MFVTPTGTVYLGTATATAHVIQPLNYSSTLTVVGQAYSSGFIDYGFGYYLGSGNSYQLSTHGNISPNLIYPGLIINYFVDSWTSGGIASGSNITLKGFTADPGQSFFTSVTANGVTLTSASATYTYFTTGSGETRGVASWSWSGQFGLKNISSTTITINGLTQNFNQSIEAELSGYYPTQGVINLNTSSVRRLGQHSSGTIRLSDLRNRAITNMTDKYIYAYTYSSANYPTTASYTVNLVTGAVTGQAQVNGYSADGYPITYPQQLWQGTLTDISLYSVQAIYNTSTSGTLTPTSGALNTWHQFTSTGGTTAWALTSGAVAVNSNITLKIQIKENASSLVVDSCLVTLANYSAIAPPGGGGGGGVHGGGNIKPF